MMRGRPGDRLGKLPINIDDNNEDFDIDLEKLIIEENDELYDEINYMEPYDEMKNDPERKAFL